MNRRRSKVLVAAQAEKVERTAHPPAADARMKTIDSLWSADGHPWVQGIVRAFVDKLRETDTTTALYRIQPDYEKLLPESQANKIWCQQCEPNVRLLLDMRNAWSRIRHDLFRNDVSTNLPCIAGRPSRSD